jgi:hypothetical protein
MMSRPETGANQRFIEVLQLNTMKLIQSNCRAQFAAEDIEFILSVLGGKIGTADCLIKLLADEDSRDVILDDEALLHALLERRGCLNLPLRNVRGAWFPAGQIHWIISSRCSERSTLPMSVLVSIFGCIWATTRSSLPACFLTASVFERKNEDFLILSTMRKSVAPSTESPATTVWRIDMI